MIQVEIANEQPLLAIDEERLAAAVRAVLTGEGVEAAEISLAIVDDARIHEVNRQFLQHDYPTDVLSFVLEDDGERLEGEVVASAEFAMSMAERYGWRPHDELLLYVVHGTLHLAGYDDLQPDLLAAMRERERHYLGQFGLTPHYDEPA